MGGFSDNYECGYWGDETPPRQKNKQTRSKVEALTINKKYVIKSNVKYRYLKVLLTPINLLNEEEQEERTNLIQLCNTETELTLVYEKDLNIYYDDVFIGSVQKVFENGNINNTKIVNDFCFKENKLQDIEALWSGEFFYLREKNS
jgi:hypothetical protein